MPRYDLYLTSQTNIAIGIVRAGELAYSTPSVVRKEWSKTRLEFLYELAYLRVFAAWENCLESIFYRSLCGYSSRIGRETLIIGRHYPTLAAAEAAVLGGNQYTLWHSSRKVLEKCRRFIRSGLPGCPAIQENTISSNSVRLDHLAAIRHRIVHEQADAKGKFDNATLLFAGRTYPASRPGKFLRDWSASSTRQRWIDAAALELINITSQIV